MPLRFSSSATKFRMRKCDWTALIVLNLQARNEVNITNLQSNMSERHYLSDEMVSTQMKTCSSGTRTKTSLNSVQRRYNRLKIKVAEQALLFKFPLANYEHAKSMSMRRVHDEEEQASTIL